MKSVGEQRHPRRSRHSNDRGVSRGDIIVTDPLTRRETDAASGRDAEARELFPDLRLRVDLLQLRSLQPLTLLLLLLELLDRFQLDSREQREITLL